MGIYTRIVIEGLLANPKFLEHKECWRNSSLFEELQSRKIDLKKIDSIFRSHHQEVYLIAEWIAARDWSKKIHREFKFKSTPDVVEIFKEDYRKVLDEVQKVPSTIGKKKERLRKKVADLYGKKALSKLTRNDPSKWPIFSSMMFKLYELLLQSFPTTPHNSDNPRDRHEFAIYPQHLFEVIGGLLEEYYPAYFKDFSPDSVKSRIQLSLQNC